MSDARLTAIAESLSIPRVERHIFMCADSSAPKCAPLVQTAEVWKYLKTRLKELGVAIVIDDFGTGYSSLSYLKRFPVDKLKIDKSFFAEVPENREHKAIVAAITALAHALDLKVVAEGVETEAQLDFAQRCKCDYIQGYLAGPPVDGTTAAKDYV